MSDRPSTETTRFPGRASSWQLRGRTLEFGARPLLMGIVNATPDSFSDGGKFFSTQAAIDHALKLVEEGVAIIDIGGESTRPYSEPVTADEELRRVLPVIAGIASHSEVAISIDTSKAIVAREAIASGARIVNDVTAVTGDTAMTSVLLETGTAVCAMHMQGTPQTMQDDPQYANVVSDVLRYLAACRDRLVNAGVDRAKICLDPGIGFGKTHQHNLDLLGAASTFHELGCPLLLGYSRKGFLGKVLGDKQADRTFAGLGVAVALACQCVQILRVHDVAATLQALTLFEAVGGLDGRTLQLDPPNA